MGQSRGGRAPIEVLVVSLGSTHGLRIADEQLAGALERAGASVEIARPLQPRPMRTLMLTDLSWAWAARKAATEALRRVRPRAIIYSSTTAALMWPRPGAIRFDAPSAGNRPGRHGLWQRPLERRRLAQAPLLLPWSEGALRELSGRRGGERGALVLPVAVEPSGPLTGERDIAAITYAANPSKKGLDRVLAAWRAVSGEEGVGVGELVVAGAGEDDLRRAGLTAGGAGVRSVGPLPRDEYRALLRRARVFVCAPRREDYGIAQLEALADGCQLVTTPAPGPYAALPLARELDARLVSLDLAGALRTALEDPVAGYAARAAALLEPFGREAVERVVTEALLPRLLA